MLYRMLGANERTRMVPRCRRGVPRGHARPKGTSIKFLARHNKTRQSPAHYRARAGRGWGCHLWSAPSTSSFGACADQIRSFRVDDLVFASMNQQRAPAIACGRGTFLLVIRDRFQDDAGVRHGSMDGLMRMTFKRPSSHVVAMMLKRRQWPRSCPK